MAIRIFWALFLGCCVSFSFYRALTYEKQVARTGEPEDRQPGRETVVWVSPIMVPLFFAVMLVCGLLIRGSAFTAQYLWEMILELMILLTCYYGVLLAALPLLRRVFSARACAVCWLLPVFLYWFRHTWENHPVKPWLIFHIQPKVMNILAWIWAGGAVIVLLWQLVGHLRFRRQVLRDARPVRDAEILKLWEDEQRRIERKKPIPLLISPAVTTPMTVGFWSRKLRTVLPERSDTPEELKLIFRHELRHVQRRDVDTKVLLAFFEAVCWFDPLVWIAARRAIADLELSCDEMVTFEMTEAQRRQYASLLLHTAGDARGFSTCLSASARTLRYRLKNVMTARKRLPGTLLLGLVTVALVMSCGLVTVTADYGTVDSVLLTPNGAQTVQEVAIRHPDAPTDVYTTVYEWDEAALLAQLRDLPITCMGRGYDTPMDRTHLFLSVAREDGGFLWLWLYEDTIAFYKSGVGEEFSYRLEQKPDWDAILSCLNFEAVNPSPGYEIPMLNLWFGGMDEENPIMADFGVGGDADVEPEWSVMVKAETDEAQLDFDLTPEAVQVSVEGLGGEAGYTETLEPQAPVLLELADYDARYTVTADYVTEEASFSVYYCFQVRIH